MEVTVYHFVAAIFFIVIGIIVAKNYNKILIKYKDMAATFENTPVPSDLPVPTASPVATVLSAQSGFTRMIKGFGNVSDSFKGELKNHEEEYTDKITVKDGTSVEDALNINNKYEKEIEGGTRKVNRVIDI